MRVCAIFSGMDFCRRFVCLLALVYVCLWLPGAYKRAAHPFRMSKCKVEWPYVSQWETGDPPAEVKTIFQKPFTYLAKGKQSYVFLSADGAHVLKLFRFDQCKITMGKKIFSLVRKWKGRPKQEKKKPFLERMEQTFASAVLAYQLAQRQTGVVWVHMNLDGKKIDPFAVKDKLGRNHCVDPGRYRFVLQRRAKPISEIGELSASFEQLMRELDALHLWNEDPKILGNFGILDGRVVLIDIGNFLLKPDDVEKVI